VVRACNEAGMFLKDKKLLTKYRYMQQKEKKDKSSDEKVVNDYDRDADPFINAPDETLIDKHPDDHNIRFMMCCKKEDLINVRKYQKLNHFPMSFYLGRKDQLYRNYQVQEELFPDDYNFMPKTYIFPSDAKKFQLAKDDDLHNRRKKYWIFKPSASSCGRGIKVINSSAKIPLENKGFLISDYIASPHLLKSLKYDLRVYVLVTSYDPLMIYIYNDGLVKF
jgi:tubulin polyglutamylase TTLL7